MGAPILLFRTCLSRMASSRVLSSPLQIWLGCGKSGTAGSNFGVGRTTRSVYSPWGRQFFSVVSKRRMSQQNARHLVEDDSQACPKIGQTDRRKRSSKANRSFVTEAREENLPCDNTEADDNDDQFQIGDSADDVDNADEELEEVLEVMRSGVPGHLTVASNSVCVGIDPDLSGAIAVLKSRDNCTIAEVIDVPCITVPVNKKMRRRHDYQSIAGIVNQLQAPQGSIAYVEQARPFPKDGKQGWYITGYGYGVWLGILAAAGFTVIPVQPRVWKTAMGVCGKEFTKDDSRALASSMFPLLSAQLRRKKDHGRAEALLIAAFGKGMTVTNISSFDEPSSPKRLDSPNDPASLSAIFSSQEPPF